MPLYRSFFLVLLLLPLLGNSQGIFDYTKVKIREKKDAKWIKFIKLVSTCGEGNIFLNNISKDAKTGILWDVFPESAGTITLHPKYNDVLFEGFADLGQENIEIQLIDSIKPVWKLITPGDTAFLGNMRSGAKQATFSQAELYKQIDPSPFGDPDYNPDNKVPVRLTTFQRLDPGSFNLSIRKIGKIDDYPLEFEIVSSLLLSLWMLSEKR